MPLTFFADRGRVYMADGAWDATLTAAQCDILCGIFDSQGAVTTLEALEAAMREAQGASFIPRVTSLRTKPTLIVSDGELVEGASKAVLRDMLQLSVQEIGQ